MDDELQRFLRGVIGAVEASRHEYQSLYMDHALESMRLHAALHGYDAVCDGSGRWRWVENTSGIGRTVGYHGGEPVVVSLRVEVVNLHRILFYHVTSNTVNYEMVEQWLDLNLPGSARKSDGGIVRVDASNFSNVFPSYEKIVLGYNTRTDSGRYYRRRR